MCRYASRPISLCRPSRQSQLDLDQPHAGPTRRRYLSGGERPRRRVVRPATPAGQPFRQPTTKAHLEPLPEVPTHTAHPSATPQTPHLPYRHLERKYDQSVIPSGCSVEAHEDDDELELRCPTASQPSFTYSSTTATCARRVHEPKSRVWGCPRARAAPEKWKGRATAFAIGWRRVVSSESAPTSCKAPPQRVRNTQFMGAPHNARVATTSTRPQAN